MGRDQNTIIILELHEGFPFLFGMPVLIGMKEVGILIVETDIKKDIALGLPSDDDPLWGFS